MTARRLVSFKKLEYHAFYASAGLKVSLLFSSLNDCMKKVLSLAALFLFSYAEGQGLTFNLNIGQCFSSSFEAYKDTATSYKATLEEGMKYGLDMGYVIDRNFSVNLSFQYQKASM